MTKDMRDGFDLEPVEIVERAERSPAGRILVEVVPVWRRKLPPLVRGLNRAQQGACLTYAEAYEALYASGGTLDPTAVRSGGGVGSCPSHRALMAVERMRGLRAALEGGAVVVVPGRGLAKVGQVSVSHGDLVHWVAVGELGLGDVMARLGVRGKAVEPRKRVRAGVATAVGALSSHLGYQS